MPHERKRSTAIIDTPHGVLVAAAPHKVFLLPGGGALRGETAKEALIREVQEETGLRVRRCKKIFGHTGYPLKAREGGKFQDTHTVFLVRTTGQARANKEVAYLSYTGSKPRLSRTTKEILKKYVTYKRSRGFWQRLLDRRFYNKNAPDL